MPTEGKKEENKKKKLEESEKRKWRERGQPQTSKQTQPSHSVPPPPYLGVPKATEVWIKVKQDSLGCSRQSDSPDQQNEQHNVWESGREIHHLGGERRDKHEDKHTALANSTDPQTGRDGQHQRTGQVALPSMFLSPVVERNAF